MPSAGCFPPICLQPTQRCRCTVSELLRQTQRCAGCSALLCASCLLPLRRACCCYALVPLSSGVLTAVPVCLRVQLYPDYDGEMLPLAEEIGRRLGPPIADRCQPNSCERMMRGANTSSHMTSALPRPQAAPSLHRVVVRGSVRHGEPPARSQPRGGGGRFHRRRWDIRCAFCACCVNHDRRCSLPGLATLPPPPSPLLWFFSSLRSFQRRLCAGLEFGMLSVLTANSTYSEVAYTAAHRLFSARSSVGLGQPPAVLFGSLLLPLTVFTACCRPSLPPARCVKKTAVRSREARQHQDT